jgi:primosomal protein N' (replication factor Y)
MQALASSAPDARDRFLEVETEARRRAGMPPFGRLAALILSDPDAARVDEACRRLAFLVRTPREIKPQPLVDAWLARVELPPRVRLQIDIDPYSFL